MNRLAVTKLASPVIILLVTVLPLASRVQTSELIGGGLFASGVKASTFPFDWRDGMICLPVRINGSKPLSFVLDTGSTRNLIDRSIAADLGLKTTGSGSLQGAGAGRIPIETIPDVRIGLPGVEDSGYEFAQTNLKPLESSLGVKVDGILGYEVFRRFVVTVDYDAKTLTFGQPDAFHPDAEAQALPIEVRDRWAYVKGALVLPGPVTVQDSFMIDSGSSDAVDHPIVMKLQSRVSAKSGVGLGSAVEGATARATSFQLGRYTLNSPIVSCCGATEATSKMIGNEVLRRFTVTFDYPSSRIFLKPNSSFGEPLSAANQ